jgi:hypothetical protein
MQAHPTEPAARPIARVDAGTDPDVAYAASLFLLTSRLAQQAVRAANAAGVEIPEWAGSAECMFDDHAWCVTPQPPALNGQSEPAFRPEPAVSTVPVVSMPRLSVYPLGTWLRLRFGVRRCLACGRLGQGSLQPANLLVPPHVARTWRCVDLHTCRRRRTSREGRR